MGHGSEKPARLATGWHQRLIPDNHLAVWDAAIGALFKSGDRLRSGLPP